MNKGAARPRGTPLADTASAHARLVRLQRRIFRALQAEADRVLGAPPEGIRRYEKEAKADFKPALRSKGKIARVTKSEILREIRACDVTLVADYHTFAQAQRTALRLLRESVRAGDRWVLGLEPVSSQFQNSLDLYQAGKLSLRDFHAAIRYQDDWGFPWRHYAPLFEWARESGIRLIALNRPNALPTGPGSGRDLLERDRWAAGLITDLFAARERGGKHRRGRGRLRMLVLYGEHHVGQTHLPRQLTAISKRFLGRALKTLSIHQNNDELYWRLAERRLELNTEAVKLAPRCYCVVSGTPWAKLQSLLSWLEDQGSSDSPSEDAETDYLSLIHAYGDTLAEFLGVRVAEYEHLELKTIVEADFVESLLKQPSFDPRGVAIVRHQIEHNQRIYFPRAHLAYLGSPSHNGAAEIAAIHLRRHQLRGARIPDFPGFHGIILEAAFGFFGSLVLNPRRKCDLPADHARRIKALALGARPAYLGEGEARRLALSLLRNGLEKDSAAASALRSARRAPVAFMAAQFVGVTLGQRLHRALLAGWVDLERVRKTFLTRSSGEQGDRARTIALDRLLQSLAGDGLGLRSYRSKQDRL